MNKKLEAIAIANVGGKLRYTVFGMLTVDTLDAALELLSDETETPRPRYEPRCDLSYDVDENGNALRTGAYSFRMYA